jgi:hypothetical protein
MKAGGFYDQHSTPQWNSTAAVLPWIEEAIGRMDLPPEATTLACVDYGSSEGRNSIAAMQRIVAALRCRTPRPIQTIHSDLSTNNFNALLVNLAPGGKSAFNSTEVYSAAVGGSMYAQLLPPQSAAVVTTFNALGWLSHVPPAHPGFVVCHGPRHRRAEICVSTQASTAFAAQAANDVQHFYQARAAEMVPGGVLLAATFGAGEHRRCADGLYDALNDALLEVVAAGSLPRSAYEHILMPLYFRTLDELIAPLTDEQSSVSKLFRLDRAETMEVPLPFYEAFRQTGDRAKYAADCTSFLRAFSEPVLRSQIGGSLTTAAVDPALNEIYGRVASRLAADPEHYHFPYIQIAALLTRV